MEHYTFKYTVERVLYWTLALAGLSLILSLLALIPFLNKIGSEAFAIVSILPPGLILVKYWRRFTGSASATITSEAVYIRFKTTQTNVAFKDLLKIKIDKVNGPLIRLKLKTNTVRLCANKNFTDPDPLLKFCNALIKNIENYNLGSNKKVEIVPDFIESKNGFRFLLVTTTIMFVGIGIALFYKWHVSGSLIGSFAILSSMWTVYLIAKSRITTPANSSQSSQVDKDSSL